MILPRLRCRDGRSQWLRREAAAPSQRRRKPRSRRAEGVAEKEEEAAMTG